MKKTKKELIENALLALLEGNSHDTEIAHSIADDVLCTLLIELGYKEVVDAYNEIDKWYA
jgi:hypothetical protein